MTTHIRLNDDGRTATLIMNGEPGYVLSEEETTRALAAQMRDILADADLYDQLERAKGGRMLPDDDEDDDDDGPDYSGQGDPELNDGYPMFNETIDEPPMNLNHRFEFPNPFAGKPRDQRRTADRVTSSDADDAPMAPGHRIVFPNPLDRQR